MSDSLISGIGLNREELPMLAAEKLMGNAQVSLQLERLDQGHVGGRKDNDSNDKSNNRKQMCLKLTLC